MREQAARNFRRKPEHNKSMLPPESRCARLWLTWLAPLLLWQPHRGLAADVTFSGTLERVGPESISIHLADRRVVAARLPNSSSLAARTVAAQYRMGDLVEVTCKPIRPVWEESTARNQSLEVTAL